MAPKGMKTLRAKQQRTGSTGRSHYLTNPKAIRFIAKTVDQAMSRAASDVSIHSFADFKESVQSYSEVHTGHPIGLDLCEVDGEVRGFRFYLQSDPDKTITGKYLATNTDQEADTYTPRTIAHYFGFDPTRQRHDDFELDSDELDGIDSELFDDEDFFDEGDDFESQSTPSQSLDEFDDEGTTAPPSPNPYMGSLNQLKGKGSGVRVRHHHGPYIANPAGQLLSEVDYAGRRATTQGADLNGINLAGAGMQGSAAIAASFAALIAHAETDEQRRRIEALEEGFIYQGERINQQGTRLHQLLQSPEESAVPNPFETALDKLSIRINHLGESAASATKTPYHPLHSPKLDPRDSLTERLDKLENYLKALTEKLDQLETRIDRLETLIEDGINQDIKPQVESLKAQALGQNSGAMESDRPAPAMLHVDHRSDPSITPTQHLAGTRVIHALQHAIPAAFTQEEANFTLHGEHGELEFSLTQTLDHSQRLVGTSDLYPEQPIFEGTIASDQTISIRTMELTDADVQAIDRLREQPTPLREEVLSQPPQKSFRRSRQAEL